MSLDEQRSLYTRAKLNKHSESNFHTRHEQVKIAFDIDKDDADDIAKDFIEEQGL